MKSHTTGPIPSTIERLDRIRMREVDRALAREHMRRAEAFAERVVTVTTTIGTRVTRIVRAVRRHLPVSAGGHRVRYR